MYRILLLDDEINVLSALKRVLMSIPYDELDDERPDIETFVSAQQALARMAIRPIDLVIADYRMPEMSGVDFLTEAARLQPDTARLILSGHADLDALIEAINRARITRFIAKPWNDFELKSAVVQALAAREQLLENRRLADIVRSQHGSALLDDKDEY